MVSERDSALPQAASPRLSLGTVPGLSVCVAEGAEALMGGEQAGSEAGKAEGGVRAVGSRGHDHPREATPGVLGFCQGASERQDLMCLSPACPLWVSLNGWK